VVAASVCSLRYPFSPDRKGLRVSGGTIVPARRGDNGARCASERWRGQIVCESVGMWVGSVNATRFSATSPYGARWQVRHGRRDTALAEAHCPRSVLQPKRRRRALTRPLPPHSTCRCRWPRIAARPTRLPSATDTQHRRSLVALGEAWRPMRGEESLPLDTRHSSPETPARGLVGPRATAPIPSLTGCLESRIFALSPICFRYAGTWRRHDTSHHHSPGIPCWFGGRYTRQHRNGVAHHE